MTIPNKYRAKDQPYCSMCPMRGECESRNTDVFVWAGCPLWDDEQQKEMGQKFVDGERS